MIPLTGGYRRPIKGRSAATVSPTAASQAGLIVAIFMHMAWERLALIYAILVPPVAVLVFVAIMFAESNYTFLTRLLFAGPGS